MRLFYIILAVAICCTACESGDGNVELTPMEQDLLEIDELIDSQSPEDIDDEALVADLTTGVFLSNSWYASKDGLWSDMTTWLGTDVSIDMIFMEDGTCRRLGYYCMNPIGFSSYLNQLGYAGVYYEYRWSYDADTHTISTSSGTDEMKAVVQYYKDHRIILKGNICNSLPDSYDFTLISAKTDIDNREDYFAKTDICYEEALALYEEHMRAEQ